MKVVIDIPEEIIKEAKESPNFYPSYQFETIWKSICNGTVLPKNHGQLKDINDLRKSLRDFRAFHKTLEQALNETPIILEAREAIE